MMSKMMMMVVMMVVLKMMMMIMTMIVLMIKIVTHQIHNGGRLRGASVREHENEAGKDKKKL